MSLRFYFRDKKERIKREYAGNMIKENCMYVVDREHYYQNAHCGGIAGDNNNYYLLKLEGIALAHKRWMNRTLDARD